MRLHLIFKLSIKIRDKSLNSNLVRLHYNVNDDSIRDLFALNSNLVRLHLLCYIRGMVDGLPFKFQSGATAFRILFASRTAFANFKFQSGATALDDNE